MMILCCVLILSVYTILIVSLIYGFWKVPTIQLQEIEATTEFSVIIPFRNEATTLPNLFLSIVELNYPNSKVSFWFVDDDSEDASVEILQRMHAEYPNINLTILSNKRTSNSPKKDAITTAISQIQSDWIVTTDADCILPKDWLLLLNQQIVTTNAKMLVAPVTYVVKKSFFNYFQLLDFLSLQGTTIGTFGLNIPFMCNGANLAYQKDTFLEVQGFSGNDTIASGDDVFLLEKFIQKYPKQVQYVKSTKVLAQTFAVQTWQAFVSQRIRWASKSANYQLPIGKLIGVIVLVMNLIFCLLPILLVTSTSWSIIAGILISKVLIDSLLLLQTLHFTQQKIKYFYIICSGFLYPFLAVFIFFTSLFSSYNWKGRVFDK